MKLLQKRNSLVMKQPEQAWFDAVQANDLEKMQQIFTLCGIAVDFENYQGYTALMEAVRNNNVAIVAWLLQMGADVTWVHHKVEHKKTRSFTPGAGLVFRFACSRSSLEVAQLLYATGKISMDSVQDGLVAALNYRGYEMVTWLLSLGANIQQVDEQGRTIFLLACHYASLQVAQLVWNSGKFSLDTVDHEGKNALLHTIDLPSSCKGLVERKENQLAIVVWLISLGIDVTYKNKQGASVWLIAARRGHLEILEMLHATHKININEQDNQGDTALMYAHDPEIIQKLLSWGVDRFLQNKQHQTALEFRIKECGRNEYCGSIDEMIAALKH